MRGDMSFEYDEKGKRFTDVITKHPVYATIQTTTQLIRGYIHIRHDQRIKDELDLDEKFLAVTDGDVLAADGTVLYKAPFLALQRSQIVWVLPEQNQHREDL
jgi:hypothetical protein